MKPRHFDKKFYQTSLETLWAATLVNFVDHVVHVVLVDHVVHEVHVAHIIRVVHISDLFC